MVGKAFAGMETCAALKASIDWPAFLSNHDLVWEDLPWQWNEGAFLGNGQLGLVVYATLSDNRIDFHLGRADVTDHRKAPDRKISRAVPGAGVMYEFPRLDLGRLCLRPAGRITGGRLRLDLWNAELTGRIQTDRGELHLRVVTLRERMADRIDIHSTEKDASGNALPWRWDFLPGNPASPRAQVFPDRPESKAYETNPPPRLLEQDSLKLCIQPLLAGGDYATAWTEKRGSASGTLLVTTANEVPKQGRSAAVACETLARAGAEPEKDLERHRAWWHRYYPQAFLTVPDPQIEAFYWIQIYKLAAASRPEGPPIDVLGPFFRITQWPGLWWNLNVQLTYWPVYSGNRLDLGRNLITELDDNFEGLYAGFRNTPKLGDFAWVLHNYWLHFRYAGDWATLRERWTPKARIIADDYLRRLEKDADGRLQLPNMESPEYDGFTTFQNSNYNLALLRWLLNALLEVEAHKAGTAEPAAGEWRRVLATLVPYPSDENGLRIASDQAVAKSHRHYSHLLGLYPLFQLNPDSAADRELVVRSVKHWHRIGEGKGLAGYSYTGGASLYAALGLGDDALGLLQRFLNGDIGISSLLPNTLYVESGGKNPVIETPLSAAASTTELLLQSWGGKLRVFPATPTSWSSACFHQLRGEGGFLVSAVREDGKTAWVLVQSEAGEPCILQVRDWKSAPIQRGKPVPIRRLAPGEFRLELKRGECVWLRNPEGSQEPVLKPLPIPENQRNPFGLKAGRHLNTIQAWPEGALRIHSLPDTRPAS